MPSSVTYTGWGSTAWGQGSWGTDLIVVSVDGVQATANLGSVTVSGAATVQPSGLEATGGIGTVVVAADANVSVTGEEATTSLGSVTVIGDANVSPSGLETTGSIGTVSVSGDANLSVTGVAGTGAIGTVTVAANAVVSATGVEATGSIGSTAVVADANVSPIDWTPPVSDNQAYEEFFEKYKERITDAYSITKKQERNTKLSNIKTEIIESDSNEDEDIVDKISGMFEKAQKNIVRKRIIDGEKRIDGRDTVTVRPIDVKVGILPRTHGSALFTRGETQALVVTALGTEKDAQMIDSLDGRIDDTFIFHYNFPPYSVGEIGRTGSPKRREIGHGKLARRGIQSVVPTVDEFPYTIRVVSEILESNGSSSMASVCGSSLSMMDAGVPIKRPVAGIAMGLVKEGDKHVVLTDILGDEDHLGDMDFKVAGTSVGINALQMDIKVDGITSEIMSKALAQARDARLHILSEMGKVISEARKEPSPFAPRYTHVKIDQSKIAAVIGKGGATIKSIIEKTGAQIDIDDSGLIKIASNDQSIGDKAKEMIEEITVGPQVDKIYEGKVVKIMDFGAFVSITPSQDGLVHISQISEERVNNVSDVLTEGDVVKVKVLEVDKQGRVKLTMKNLD